MGLITRMRRQDAVYWAPVGRDDEGRPIVEDPVEIKCRWEDAQIMYLDEMGREQVSNCLVYVDRVVKVGGVLWLGDMNSSLFVSQTNPFENEGAFEIKRFNSVPKLNLSETLYEAIL